MHSDVPGLCEYFCQKLSFADRVTPATALHLEIMINCWVVWTQLKIACCVFCRWLICSTMEPLFSLLFSWLFGVSILKSTIVYEHFIHAVFGLCKKQDNINNCIGVVAGTVVSVLNSQPKGPMLDSHVVPFRVELARVCAGFLRVTKTRTIGSSLGHYKRLAQGLSHLWHRPASTDMIICQTLGSKL